MCGFVAIIASEKSDNLDAELRASLQRIDHRGRMAGVTTWINSGNKGVAGLGCNRLPIVDQDGGGQPMSTQDKTVTVVFNGEIYNHNDLRRELEEAGCSFLSKSDTEVLLHGYQKWGGRTLRERIKGMYAFVIYDNTEGAFFAARDRFGIKPLYYIQSSDTWRLASELKAVAQPANPTVCDAIREVPPGGWIENKIVFKSDGTHLGKEIEWYQPRFGVLGDSDIDEEEAVAKFRALLGASVKRMTETQHKVGVLLSGGIDSAAILFEAAACVDRGRLVAFCVGAAKSKDIKRKDSHDPSFARKCAKRLNVDFEFIELKPHEMTKFVKPTVQIIESFEPNHIRAGTAHVKLAEGVRKHGVSVVLCGEGADELLGGYQEYVQAREKPEQLNQLFRTFSEQLYRTQLQRVDRVMMAHGIEARVPFLDEDLVDFIWSLPSHFKIREETSGKVRTKWILREAYRVEKQILFDVADSRIVPMGEGAGVGDNSSKGSIFTTHAEGFVHNDTLERYRKDFSSYEINTKEEALYFGYFLANFGPLKIATLRPTTNVLETQ